VRFLPRYWLSGEEKKLLYKLRQQKKLRQSDSDYWRHIIPRTDEELNLILEIIPVGAWEEEKEIPVDIWEEELKAEFVSSREAGETLIFEEFKDYLQKLHEEHKIQPWDEIEEKRQKVQKTGISGIWFWQELDPFTIHTLRNPTDPKVSRFESREWVPEVRDAGQWRNASDWEGEHWNELITCQSCGHPTIPQFQCNVCGANLAQPLKDTEKRVTSLICILPDIPVEEILDRFKAEKEEQKKREEPEEPTELEEIVEEVVDEKQPEREEESEISPKIERGE
jgi:hypothetical protein